MKCVKAGRCENTRARTGSERSGRLINDRDFRVSLLGRQAYVDSPFALMPGRLSNRRDLRGGRDVSARSLNAVGGNEETCS